MIKEFKFEEYEGVNIKYKTKKQLEKKKRAINNKLIKERMKKWKEAIYLRDNYTCQICGKSYKDKIDGLNPMHILSKENYPDLQFDIMNGLTGCYYCHNSSPKSPHLDGFVFTHWLKENKENHYYYLVSYLVMKGGLKLKQETWQEKL